MSHTIHVEISHASSATGPDDARDAFDARVRRLREHSTPHTADAKALTVEFARTYEDGSVQTTRLRYEEASDA